MHATEGHNPFAPIVMPACGTPLVTHYESAALTLARFRSDGAGEYTLGLPNEDAFVVVHQLSALQPHDFWFDGREGHTDAIPGSVTNIFDLNANPGCRIGGPVDSIHLHIPRVALDSLAIEVDARRVDELRSPLGWQTRDPIIAQLIASILPATERPSEVSRLFVDHILLALHIHLARSYGGMLDVDRPRSGGLAPWQERRAKELLAANLGNEVPLERIARECGLSVSYFSRAFRISTGTTPHEWLQGCRIERAKDMLAQADRSLAEIALACGFADQSHFTKVFARMAGQTPGAWRRLRRPG